MSAQPAVKIGVIGTSWWSDAMYMPALAAHPNAQVSAVVGRHPERTRAFAQQWHVPAHYTDYQTMLNSESLDAVLISTPNNEHYPMAMAAIERGLHVLCEKPLALDYARAKAMTDAAQSAGVKTMVPFTYSFMPTARYLKQLIANGYIGTPYHLNMRYYTGYAREGDYLWRFDRELAGAGVVGDLGTHFLYLADWIYGDVTAITTLLGYHVERAPRPDGASYDVTDDSAIMLLEFASGAQGVIHVTAVAYEDTPFGQTHHMEFHGSGGTLYSFTDWDTIQQVRGAKVGEGMLHDLPIPDAIWGKVRLDTVHNTYKDLFRVEDFMTRGFVNAILNDTAPSPDFNDGLRVQRYLQAALLSAQESRRVQVSEIV